MFRDEMNFERCVLAYRISRRRDCIKGRLSETKRRKNSLNSFGSKFILLGSGLATFLLGFGLAIPTGGASLAVSAAVVLVLGFDISNKKLEQKGEDTYISFWSNNIWLFDEFIRILHVLDDNLVKELNFLLSERRGDTIEFHQFIEALKNVPAIQAISMEMSQYKSKNWLDIIFFEDSVWEEWSANDAFISLLYPEVTPKLPSPALNK